MKVLDILLREADATAPEYDPSKFRSGRYTPGYYTIGDSHARALGIKEPWDHDLSKNGASSADEDFAASMKEYIPRGSVVVISLGANDATKTRDNPATIANRVKQVVDASKSRNTKTVFLLFPAGPSSSKLYDRRVAIRKALEATLQGSVDRIYDLNTAPLQADGVHAQIPYYGRIGNEVVNDFSKLLKNDDGRTQFPGLKDTNPEIKQSGKPEEKKDAKPEEKKDAKPEEKKDAKPEEVSRVSGVAPISGKLIVNSPYGKRSSGMHYGVDLKAASGTPLLSPITGNIIKAGEEGVCGGSITVRTADGKEQHRFCHIKKFNVSVGQQVKAGDVIGLTGGAKGDPMAGNATGPNLHWEKKLNGSLVDPMSTQSVGGQGAMVGPGPNATPKSSKETVSMSSVSDYLKSKGMDDNHRRGILANIEGESSFMPGVLIKDVNGLPSGGLFQHNGPRYAAMTKAVPDWQTNWQGQVDFALDEPAGRSYLAKTFKDVGDAIAYWLEKFEVTADPVGDLAKRTNFASSIAESIN